MNKSKKCVLVVDDNPTSLEISEKFLASDGYNVVSAWDGEQCLSLAGQIQPDAILLDVILPDIDGKELAQTLSSNESTKNIPIIFTTNTVSLEDDKGSQSFEVGDKVYRAFAKPLHQKKILSVIKKEINRMKHGGQLPESILKDEGGQ